MALADIYTDPDRLQRPVRRTGKGADATWTEISSFPKGATPVADPADPTLFYAYDTDTGTLYASADSGLSFTERATGLPSGDSQFKLVAAPGRHGGIGAGEALHSVRDTPVTKQPASLSGRTLSAPASTLQLCTVVLNYSHQCIAVAIDPAAGTPGWGWAGGRYVVRPARYRSWAPGAWHHGRHGWYYVEGHWR